MKRSLLLFAVMTLFLCLASQGFAQTTIPNAGFENWTNGIPDGWYADNIPTLAVPVTKSTTAHSGSGALRGDVVGFGVTAPTPYAPVVQSGTTAQGFAWNQRSATFTGYYQFSPFAGKGDRLSVILVMWKGSITSGTAIASGATTYSNAVSSYTQFSMPITWITNDTPDNCTIQFAITNPNSSSTVTIGSYFLIDDIALTGTAGATAVDDHSPSAPAVFALEQNYPNPFNPSTKINFSVAQAGHVTLKVYNILGTEVASLVNEQRDAGMFSVNWNAAGLPSGMYLYRLSVTSDKGQLFDQAKKLVLLK